MTELIQVTVSGAVGKQVYKTSGAKKSFEGEVGSTQPVMLEAIYLTPSGANATVTIRSGNASGDVKFFGRAPSAAGTMIVHGIDGMLFNRGMHVKVIGANAQAYLLIS